MRAAFLWGSAAVATAAAYAAGCPRAQVWGRGFYRGPRDGPRRVALTFDDGPSPWTAPILDLLDRRRARATFFVCGLNLERMPEAASAALDLGCEIGNHGWDHRPLSWLSPRAVLNQVGRTQAAIEDRLGVSPRLFRPPYGARSPWMPAAMNRFGLVEARWSVIGNDWKLPAGAVARRVLSRVDPGAIICLHDGDGVRPRPDREGTVKALAEILAALADDGCEFVTASEIGGVPPIPRRRCP